MASSSSSSPIRGWLRPSAIEGWRALTKRLAAAPNESAATAVIRLRASYATGGFDYGCAETILEMVGPADDRPAACYRRLIEMEVATMPAWLAVVPRGRHALWDALTADALECFRRAGVFDDNPSPETVALLDRLANSSRALANLPLVDSGRRAERWSFELEVSRCATWPDAPAVEWMALDDNSAGYDILSWDWSDGRWARKLIEVKSCRGRPLRIIMTRNEWNTACRQPQAYVVHLWDVINGQLHELFWDDLKAHMPVDQGDGRWDSVTITVTWLHGP